jgi:D-alanine-D-alanine ligase
MKNIKVLVLEGGNNEEHEVSLSTSKEVKNSLLNLDIDYDVLSVFPDTFEKDISKFNPEHICFNALHGTFGEDGRIQKILEEANFKHTHSNIKSSSISFDKALTKKEIQGTSIIMPKSLTLDYQEIDNKTLFDIFLKFGSFVIKPISSGSSYGVKIFKDEKSIVSFLKNYDAYSKIYQRHQKILIEKFIEGRELSVSVIERNGISYPVEVTEIVTNNSFFDYESKYTSGFSRHILPAELPHHIYDKCKADAKLVHDQLKCQGISRSDFIYNNDENIYFLEINSQPGLTPTSLLPEQFEYNGISFDDLILNLLKCTL